MKLSPKIEKETEKRETCGWIYARKLFSGLSDTPLQSNPIQVLSVSDDVVDFTQSIVFSFRLFLRGGSDEAAESTGFSFFDRSNSRLWH